MWTYNDKEIRVGKSWVDDNGVEYSATWNDMTDAEKQSAGLVFVPDVEVVAVDRRFYKTDGTPKELDDVLGGIDENGDQIVYEGIKTQAIKRVKKQAAGRLQSTDWMIIREQEGVAASAEVKEYRAAVRARSNEMELAINGCTNVEELEALHNNTAETPAYLNAWPEEV